MIAAIQLYERALRESGHARVHFEDGSHTPLLIGRFLAAADAEDRTLLSGVTGPVLDVGCGPGRHLHALKSLGVEALGVDVSPVAVEIARAGGADAIVGDVFGDTLTRGAWATALLLDGNIGIGGRPTLLLRRLRQLLAPDGVVLAEVEAPSTPSRAARARIESAGEASGWFPWARVSISEVDRLAAAAQMTVEERWPCGERWFVRLRSLPRALITVLTLALAAVPIGVYLWLAGHRIGYPYELDWLEGGTVELVRRVMDGQGLYSPPSLRFVGFTYTPLYSLVCAAVAEVVGIGFLPLRIVSLASSLATMGILAAYVRDVTGDWRGGAVAAGVFAACYTIGGDAFDVGRLDSMFLALALLSLWMGRRAGSVRAGLGVGLIAFLAFFTKQVGLIVVIPALGVLALQRPRVGAAALGVLLGLVLASTVILDAATGDWYRYYVVSELSGQPVIVAQYGLFWTGELLKHLWPVALLALVALLARAAPVTYRMVRTRRRSGGRWTILRAIAPMLRQRPAVYDLTAMAGLLAAAWISIIHSGGWLNVLMPAYAAVAGLGGVAFVALSRRGWPVAVAACTVLACQFALLLNGAGVALPTHADRVGGAELTAALHKLPGPVLLLRHPWYATEAGKGTFAQSDGIAEVMKSLGHRGAPYLRRVLRGALNRYHIQAVVLDGAPPSWLAPQLAADFRLVPGTITATPLRPPRDFRSAPTYLYLRAHR